MVCLEPGSRRTNKQDNMNVNELWKIFKNNLIKSVESNIPSKLLTYKHRLL